MKNYFKYLNISAIEENWGLYITNLGYNKIYPKQVYPNNEGHPQDHAFNWYNGRVLNSYNIIFISKGRGTFESAKTKSTIVEAGTCFFLYPGVWHRYKPDLNSGWEEFWVGFNGKFSHELMHKNFSSSENPFIHVGYNQELLSLFTHLFDTVKKGSRGYPQVIAGITLQILAILNSVSLYDNTNNDVTSMLIEKAKFLIQESLEKPLDMAMLLKELPIGYSRFRKAFKTITGESPNQYHLNLRLNRAKNLLLTTNLNINEVADQTGFDSVFYFSKLFKIKNGVSPKNYRAAKKKSDSPDE
ncbi:MAG: AraC family transcriptional regulator [Chitinophagaceae bacterium]|nr:AraC family transcriptional regulator [Chitinophagaceae bacterium]